MPTLRARSRSPAALFFHGIAGVTSNMTLKLGTLGTGAAIFIFSLILLIIG